MPFRFGITVCFWVHPFWQWFIIIGRTPKVLIQWIAPSDFIFGILAAISLKSSPVPIKSLARTNRARIIAENDNGSILYLLINSEITSSISYAILLNLSSSIFIPVPFCYFKLLYTPCNQSDNIIEKVPNDKGNHNTHGYGQPLPSVLGSFLTDSVGSIISIIISQSMVISVSSSVQPNSSRSCTELSSRKVSSSFLSSSS